MELANPLPDSEENAWTYCAYCNEVFTIDDAAVKVTQHIQECEQHPMRRLEQENLYLRQLLMDTGIRPPDRCI